MKKLSIAFLELAILLSISSPIANAEKVKTDNMIGALDTSITELRTDNETYENAKTLSIPMPLEIKDIAYPVSWTTTVYSNGVRNPDTYISKAMSAETESWMRIPVSHYANGSLSVGPIVSQIVKGGFLPLFNDESNPRYKFVIFKPLDFGDSTITGWDNTSIVLSGFSTKKKLGKTTEITVVKSLDDIDSFVQNYSQLNTTSATSYDGDSFIPSMNNLIKENSNFSGLSGRKYSFTFENRAKVYKLVTIVAIKNDSLLSLQLVTPENRFEKAEKIFNKMAQTIMLDGSLNSPSSLSSSSSSKISTSMPASRSNMSSSSTSSVKSSTAIVAPKKVSAAAARAAARLASKKVEVKKALPCTGKNCKK